MSLRGTYSPLRSSEDSPAHSKTMMPFPNLLSPRRLRIVIILGAFMVLIVIFVGFDRRLSNLPSQFHDYTHRNTSSSDAQGQNIPTCPKESVRWSEFAYVQYVTNPNYLCNSLMILEALRRHGTKADLLMLYPQEWEVPAVNESSSKYESRLLAQARDVYGTKLSSIQLMTFENEQDPTWQDSYTKLLAWNQTQYKRVISLDSDATVLDHMDELFLLPPAPVAMPRAYWGDNFFLSSQLIVVEPSEEEWERVRHAIDNHEGHDYDMDILNKVYGASSIVIPHRKYDLLTGEFRHKIDDHAKYLGSPREKWDARDVLAETKFVHYSDWPMPKPWLVAKEEDWIKYQPDCRALPGNGTEFDCSDREVWVELRTDFSARRERICGQAYDGPAPDHARRRDLRPRNEPDIIR